MKKKHLFTVLFTALVAVVNAQSNFGIDYFGMGEIQTAKTYFEKQVTQSPAESNYYLGEIAFAEGKMDEAKTFYDKGIAASPEYQLNYIGQGKLLLKTNQKEAENLFATALKKNKKNAEVNVAIARAYLENGMKDAALLKIEVAKKYGKKSPFVYILEGDMLQADGKFGEAAGKYEQAVYFDPNCTIASIKCAQVYESINPNLSIEILKKVLVAHPDYTIANKGLGRSYSLNGQYKDAIDAFKVYTVNGQLNLDDIIKFATSYYYTEQYPQSIELINEGMKIDSTNFVLNRFRMYNAAKTNDAVNGLAYADYFFTLKSEKGFIPSDYTAYATVLSLAGQFDKALGLYGEALKVDPNNAALYKELFSVYNKMGDNAKASETYSKYIELIGPDNVTSYDYYQLGRFYYAAASASKSDSSAIGKALTNEYLVKADTTFGIVCALTPDSYLGYLYRGHTNAMRETDPSQGLGKPYYEAAINSILAKNKETGTTNNKKELILAYTYLGYYYYIISDKVNATKYWTLVLELDPTNANAKLVLDEYSKPPKKK